MRLFNLLVRRLNKKQDDERYNHANILAAIHNTQATEQKDILTAEDILGIKKKRPSQKDLDIKIINAFATLKAINNAK